MRVEKAWRRKMISNVKALSDNVRTDVPCPVCGAKGRPYSTTVRGWACGVCDYVEQSITDRLIDEIGYERTRFPFPVDFEP